MITTKLDIKDVIYDESTKRNYISKLLLLLEIEDEEEMEEKMIFFFPLFINIDTNISFSDFISYHNIVYKSKLWVNNNKKGGQNKKVYWFDEVVKPFDNPLLKYYYYQNLVINSVKMNHGYIPILPLEIRKIEFYTCKCKGNFFRICINTYNMITNTLRYPNIVIDCQECHLKTKKYIYGYLYRRKCDII